MIIYLQKRRFFYSFEA